MARLPEDVAATADKAEAFTGFKPIPAGIYEAQCKEVDFGVEKADGSGLLAKWVFKLSEGQFHADGKAVRQIQLFYRATYAPESAGLLAAPFRAMGLPMSVDSEEMIGCLVRLDVGVQPKREKLPDGSWGVVKRDDGTFDEVNYIKAVLPLDGASGTSTGANGATMSRPAPASEAAAWD